MTRKAGTLLSTYGLAISVTIDDDRPIGDEIRHVNEAIINWLRERRHSARGLKLFFVAPAVDHDIVIAWVRRLLTKEVDVRPYLNKLRELDMFLSDPDTREERYFDVKLSG